MKSKGAVSVIMKYIDSISMRPIGEVDKLLKLGEQAERFATVRSVAEDRILELMLLCLTTAVPSRLWTERYPLVGADGRDELSRSSNQ